MKDGGRGVFLGEGGGIGGVRRERETLPMELAVANACFIL